eukprot:TRINITY_DN19252_c0_g1_i1.p1 TRINITY_DN19252_c0_g1~~TRINITY_DN19252_c0_g1_i1.p1  ORF type:complete len:169 (+),score=22.82 TRINITY_DN19252_c0_g1_i1:62-508(+)
MIESVIELVRQMGPAVGFFLSGFVLMRLIQKAVKPQPKPKEGEKEDATAATTDQSSVVAAVFWRVLLVTIISVWGTKLYFGLTWGEFVPMILGRFATAFGFSSPSVDPAVSAASAAKTAAGVKAPFPGTGAAAGSLPHDPSAFDDTEF